MAALSESGFHEDPVAMRDRWEYGVWHINQKAGEEPHRTGMTRAEAFKWIKEWRDMGGPSGLFHMVRRPLGEWENV